MARVTPDEVLNAYGRQMFGPYPNYYQQTHIRNLIKSLIPRNRLFRELLSLRNQIRQERTATRRNTAVNSRRRTRAQLTGENYEGTFNRQESGRTTARMRNLRSRYMNLLRYLTHVTGNNEHNIINRLYTNAARISPLYSNNSEIPKFRPTRWRLSNFEHTEQIPRELVRKELLGIRPTRANRQRAGPLSQTNLNYLRALKNTVMRRIVHAQQKYRQKKTQQVGRNIGQRLSALRYLPRPVINFSMLSPNATLKPSQIKLANIVARMPKKRNNFNSENAYINYLIQGPYASTASRANLKRNKFTTTKKYFTYLVAGGPKNWNNF
jgi:hypothetical protein